MMEVFPAGSFDPARPFRETPMTPPPAPRDGRAAKWILLLFLVLVAASRLLAG